MYHIILIGCGRISKNHIAAAAANKEICKLAALCDIELDKACALSIMAFEKTGHEPTPYNDYMQAIDTLKTKVDPSKIICVIATESGYHASIALDCIREGVNVLIEKPIALSVSDAKLLISEAKAHNVKLGVCHQNRFNPPVAELHKAIENGRFGKITNGTARILWNRNDEYYKQATWRGTWALDGGTLMNQCIHDIDLLLWCLGDVDEVFAYTANYLRNIEAEDFGAIVIRFKNGAIGIVEGTACVYPKNLEETLSIFGSDATAIIGGIAVNKVERWEFAKEDEEQDLKVSRIVPLDPSDVYGSGHNLLYKDYIDACKNDRNPLVDGEAGMNAMKVILAAYKSQKEGKSVSFDDLDFSTKEMKTTDIR